MTWTLLIILSGFWGSSSPHVAIESVRVVDERSCESAGQKIKAEIAEWSREGTSRPSTRITTLCIPSPSK